MLAKGAAFGTISGAKLNIYHVVVSMHFISKESIL